MKYNSGEDFLNTLYKNLHMEEVVMHTASRSDNPEAKIAKYMKRLEDAHKMASDNKHKLDILKEFYYQKYVIKELPESYVELQKKIALEEGRGYIEVKENDRKEMLHQLQLNQKKSLDVSGRSRTVSSMFCFWIYLHM